MADLTGTAGQTQTDATALAALEIARGLARAGVPIFLARPDPAGVGHSGTGYWYPAGWQLTEADPAIVDAWRPGMALCAVMGHGLDLLDVDPRNGGNDGLAALGDDVPRSHGATATPSGGAHSFIASIGRRSKDKFLPGLDYKGGQPDGEGRGPAFLPPTIKRSKVTGELRPYRWIVAPDLDVAGDGTGAALAKLLAPVRPAVAPVVRGAAAGELPALCTAMHAFAVKAARTLTDGGSRHDAMRALTLQAAALEAAGHHGIETVMGGLEGIWEDIAPGREEEFRRLEQGAYGIVAGSGKSQPFSTVTRTSLGADRADFSSDQAKLPDQACPLCDVSTVIAAHYEPLANAHQAQRKYLAERAGHRDDHPDGSAPDWTDATDSAWLTYCDLLCRIGTDAFPVKKSPWDPPVPSVFSATIAVKDSYSDAELAWLEREGLLNRDGDMVTLLADMTPETVLVHCRACGRDHDQREFPGAPLHERCPLPGRQLRMGRQLMRVRANGGADFTFRQVAQVVNSPQYREQHGLTDCRYASVNGLEQASGKLRRAGELTQVRAPVRYRYRHMWKLAMPALFAVRDGHPARDDDATAAIIREVAPLRPKPPPGAITMARAPARQQYLAVTPEQFMMGIAA